MRIIRPVILAFTLCWGGIAAAAGAAASKVPSGQALETLALQWFAQMQSGHIDRSQLTPEYSAQLTDDAVKSMSAYLREYKYGTSPLGAQILVTRTAGDQTFDVVKLVFPRGDAASLLFGFDNTGKITGITLMSMAGD